MKEEETTEKQKKEKQEQSEIEQEHQIHQSKSKERGRGRVKRLRTSIRENHPCTSALRKIRKKEGRRRGNGVQRKRIRI
jgi:hypothetical protein